MYLFCGEKTERAEDFDRALGIFALLSRGAYPWGFRLFLQQRANSLTAVSYTHLEEILHQMGKHKPEDELNCGSCGYNTCRDKAVAVLNGKDVYKRQRDVQGQNLQGSA